MNSQSRSAARQVAARSSEDDVYDDSCLHIEHKRYFFAVKGTPMILTRTEFGVISRLVYSIDRIVTVEDLWDFAWGHEKPLNHKSIHVFVSRVRRKLSPYGIKINTVVGVGYMLSHGTCCSGGKLEQPAPTGSADL